jgi:hypothetical protein
MLWLDIHNVIWVSVHREKRVIPMRSSRQQKRVKEPLSPHRGVWRFVMVAASVEAVSDFLQEIRAGAFPFTTLAVWYALAPFVAWDTGEIVCSQRELAQTAGVQQPDAYRALMRLVEMGALLKIERGRYKVHPSLMWRGQLESRDKQELQTPVLTLLDGGKER